MVEVKLHDIGEGMTQAEITCYLVKAGDMVRADEPLVEVQTDKMTAEIPAPRAGIVRQILAEAGETVKVGTTLLIMEDSQEEGRKAESRQLPGRILASPYTRKIARENKVNITDVTGTGPAGRITDEDVRAFLKGANRSEDGFESNLIRKGVPNASEGSSEKDSPRKELPNVSERPFRGRRKLIARNMQQSLRTIPHCTHFEEVDVSELILFRNELKMSGETISATAFFIKALSMALKEFPIFNAELDEEKECIRLLPEHHIGIAVDTPEGLVVPVITHVETKNVRQIHEEMKMLTKRALGDELSVKDMSGGTFTVSNVGPLGGSIGATPIIQHPQTALVSFHKTKKRPVVNEQDEIVIRSMMNLSMAFDHRVADGATAVKFTNTFARLIENLKMMLLELR